MATAHPPAEIRNIALVGHGGSGKTTLTERLLFSAGVTQRMGSIQDKNTVSDWAEEEHHHQHSLHQTMVHFEAKSHMSGDTVVVNLLDTPGLGDFIGHAIASLPAVETAMVVIDAGKGIETVTRRIFNIAKERNLPRAIVINKIDEHNIDLEGLVERIRNAFGMECLPINLPTAGGENVVNVFETEKADGATPVFGSIEDAHQQIQEQVVEVDEALTETYFEGGELDPKKLHTAFEKCMRDGHLVPICFCSAKTTSSSITCQAHSRATRDNSLRAAGRPTRSPTTTPQTPKSRCWRTYSRSPATGTLASSASSACTRA